MNVQFRWADGPDEEYIFEYRHDQGRDMLPHEGDRIIVRQNDDGSTGSTVERVHHEIVTLKGYWELHLIITLVRDKE